VRILGPALRVLTAGALALDAYVHASNASSYDSPLGGLLTAGNLFRAEAAVASLVALAVLLLPTRRVWLLTLGVAASALGAVVLYRYVNVGAIGPIPNLYEPTWQVPGKLLSAYAEGVAVLLSGAGLLLSLRSSVTRTGWMRIAAFGRRAQPAPVLAPVRERRR
jgi:hypothetical protein